MKTCLTFQKNTRMKTCLKFKKNTKMKNHLKMYKEYQKENENWFNLFKTNWNWIGTRLNRNFHVSKHDEIQLLHNMVKLGKVIKGLLNYGR